MILTNLLGDIRLVGITGCFLSSTGFILSYFATDIKVLAFTYGALGGKSFIHLPTVIWEVSHPFTYLRCSGKRVNSSFTVGALRGRSLDYF